MVIINYIYVNCSMKMFGLWCLFLGMVIIYLMNGFVLIKFLILWFVLDNLIMDSYFELVGKGVVLFCVNLNFGRIRLNIVV